MNEGKQEAEGCTSTRALHPSKGQACIPLLCLRFQGNKTGGNSGKNHILNGLRKLTRGQRCREVRWVCAIGGAGVSGSWTDPIWAVKNFWGFMALPEELGKGTGRGNDGKMEMNSQVHPFF